MTQWPLTLVRAALASTDDDQAVFLANMMSSDFAPPGQGSSSLTHTFLAAAPDDPDMDGDQSREPAMVAGYYDGAMGTYTCSGDAIALSTSMARAS